MRKFKYQRVDLTVAGANQTATVSVNQTTTGYEKCNGVQIVCPDADALTESYFKQFTIDNNEIVPENFEAGLINSSNNVDPEKRFFSDFDHANANGKDIKIQYIDGGNAAAYPYTATIYLRLENGPHFKYAPEIGGLN